ncbi:MAG: zinc ribbon domain-containing protein [Planctomycetes bacterium]|nr:zinc ribbon domain-containing protein [Planctomycetota bacterium]
MPTYDYECSACGHSFEKFQSIKDPRIRKCPSCGRLKLRRLVGTGGAVLFKGSGFYQTDYKKSSRPDPAPACDKCDKSSNCPVSNKDSSSGAPSTDS